MFRAFRMALRAMYYLAILNDLTLPRVTALKRAAPCQFAFRIAAQPLQSIIEKIFDPDITEP